MRFQIGSKNPSIMMVGDRHVKKASMFERNSQTTINVNLNVLNYVLVNQATAELLEDSANPGSINTTFTLSTHNKNARSLTFSKIRVSFYYPVGGFPIGQTALSMMIGTTYPYKNEWWDINGQVQLKLTALYTAGPNLYNWIAEANNITVQFSYSEWNKIYTETTNSWWEEKVVYERVKNVYPNLIPYTTSPSGKEFTISYGSITEGSRRLNNVTMLHESDYYGGLSVNIAGGVYSTSRGLLSTNTFVDKDKIPYFIYDGLMPDEINISYHSLDSANRIINGLRFTFRKSYAFEGTYIGLASGDNAWSAPYFFEGGAWHCVLEFPMPLQYTQSEWNQFVVTTSIYRYTMTASSLTFTQADWDKFYY